MTKRKRQTVQVVEAKPVQVLRHLDPSGLWIGAQRGWLVLAECYPDLITKAIQMANGSYDPKGRPDRLMLKTLIELLPRVVEKHEDSSEAPIMDLVRKLKAGVESINFTQVNIGRSVEADSQ